MHINNKNNSKCFFKLLAFKFIHTKKRFQLYDLILSYKNNKYLVFIIYNFLLFFKIT